MGRPSRVLTEGTPLWRALTEPDPEDDPLPTPEELDRLFPRCRQDCRNGLRPCPFVRCEWHLYLQTRPNGTIWVNFPDRMPWELEESCLLDLVESGSPEEEEPGCDFTLKETGRVLNLTRERARQIQDAALEKLRQQAQRLGLAWEELF